MVLWCPCYLTTIRSFSLYIVFPFNKIRQITANTNNAVNNENSEQKLESLPRVVLVLLLIDSVNGK